MTETQSYFRVNDFAPKDGLLHAFFKKVGEKKSDGFVFTIDGEIFVVDSGKYLDDGVYDYLSSLHQAWLANSDYKGDNAGLEFHVIVSHPHSDHAYTLPKILSDPRFRVLNFYAPQRSYLSLDVEGALPSLTRFENKITELVGLLQEHKHPAQGVTALPFGQSVSLKVENKATAITLYTAPYDWSTTRESDCEGFNLLRKYTSPTYQNEPELGLSNGVANGNSLWVKVTMKDQCILITGDQRDSKEMLDEMIRFHGEETFCCDVLKYPHHGEKNYSPYMMKVASPTYSIITTTKNLVNPELTDLCHEYGKVFFLHEGDLFFTLDGETLRYHGIDPH